LAEPVDRLENAIEGPDLIGSQQTRLIFHIQGWTERNPTLEEVAVWLRPTVRGPGQYVMDGVPGLVNVAGQSAGSGRPGRPRVSGHLFGGSGFHGVEKAVDAHASDLSARWFSRPGRTFRVADRKA